MNHDSTDHDDLPAEIDFTSTERGKFFQSNSKFKGSDTLNFA